MQGLQQKLQMQWQSRNSPCAVGGSEQHLGSRNAPVIRRSVPQSLTLLKPHTCQWSIYPAPHRDLPKGCTHRDSGWRVYPGTHLIVLQAPRSKIRVQIASAVSGVLRVLQAVWTHSDTNGSWSHSSLGGRQELAQSVQSWAKSIERERGGGG